MKYFHSFLFLFFILVSTSSFSQDKIAYFPQEQIILKGVKNNKNASKALYKHLEQKTKRFLKQPDIIKELQELEKDTLKIGGTLIFNEKNKINTKDSHFSLGLKSLNKKFQEELETSLYDLPITSIINRKSNISHHFFQFKYKLIKTKTEVSFTLLKNEKPYSGGIIREFPIFPGCEGLNIEDSRICFKNKMKKHIAKSFRYPEEAKELNIQGKVYAIFNISKDGQIGNIRTRGPHRLLRGETIRIIKRLPIFTTPGKHNGEPVEFPFSIPISFKL